MAKLALFDLDNTLLRGDSDHAWGKFMVANGMVDTASFTKQNDEFYQDYLAGQLDMHAYGEFILSPLTRYSSSELDEFHMQFMTQYVQPMILTKGLDLIAQHREAGDILVMITATNDFVTAPIAEHLDFAHLIATTAELNDQGYTGKIDGTPCLREGKISKLKDWLDTSDYSLVGARFYSDSFNDIPLLEEVDEPVAVDPDQKLRDHANNAGWPIISLRD